MRILPLVTLLTLSTILFENTADACSCMFTGEVYDSVPADGAQNVPTDVVPWLLAGGEATLYDADGNVVPTTAAIGNAPLGCRMNVELLPSSELEPNAEYTLRVDSDDVSEEQLPGSVSFTTGAGPMEGDTPAKPLLRTAFFDASLLGNTCEQPPYQGCLVSDHEGLLDVRMRHASGEESYVVGKLETVENLLLGFADEEVCVEVSARDLAGRTSEPETSCFATGELPQLALEDAVLLPDGFFTSCASPQITALLPSSGNSQDDTLATEPEEPSTAAETATEEEPSTAGETATEQEPATVEANAAEPTATTGCGVAHPPRGAGGFGLGLVGLGLVLGARQRRTGIRDHSNPSGGQ